MAPNPQYTLRTFTCSYTSDLKKFEDLVLSKGGYLQGSLIIDRLNIWNQPVTKEYLCVYQYFEDIDMEIMC